MLKKAVLFAVFAAAGCASGKVMPAMDSWLGAGKRELIMQWGAPAQVLQDKDDEIYIYSLRSSDTVPRYGLADSRKYGTAARVKNSARPPLRTRDEQGSGGRKAGRTYQRMFWVNTRGEIFKWATEDRKSGNFDLSETSSLAGGIGIKASQDAVVTAVLPGSPAARAGMLEGDRIVRVGDKKADEAGMLVELIGPRGTSVTVAVERTGLANPLQFTMQREAIKW